MMGDEGKVLYTIGHSNLDIDTFLGYLRRYDITTLVDIRSRARSRTEPQFDRERISESLKSVGIAYRFIDYQLDHFGIISILVHDRSEEEIYDNTLGGFPKEDALYADGLPRSRSLRQLEEAVRGPFYEKIMGRPWFQQGAERLRAMIDAGERVTLFCQCKDPEMCHGKNLVAKYLLRVQPDLGINHITYEGELL